MVQLDGGAEHAAHRWDDAELQSVAATDPDQLREHRLVDRLRREDDAVDAGRATASPSNSSTLKSARWASTRTWMSPKSWSFRRVASASAPVPTMTVRSGGVVLRQRPAWRCGRRAPQWRRRARTAPRSSPGRSRRGRRREESRAPPSRSATRGGSRSLVRREMAKLALVTIVEAVHLGQHDPDRNRWRAPRRGTSTLSAEREREATAPACRQRVREREHASQQRVTPPAAEQLSKSGSPISCGTAERVPGQVRGRSLSAVGADDSLSVLPQSGGGPRSREHTDAYATVDSRSTRPRADISKSGDRGFSWIARSRLCEPCRDVAELRLEPRCDEPEPPVVSVLASSPARSPFAPVRARRAARAPERAAATGQVPRLEGPRRAGRGERARQVAAGCGGLALADAHLAQIRDRLCDDDDDREPDECAARAGLSNAA